MTKDGGIHLPPEVIDDLRQEVDIEVDAPAIGVASTKDNGTDILTTMTSMTPQSTRPMVVAIHHPHITEMINLGIEVTELTI